MQKNAQFSGVLKFSFDHSKLPRTFIVNEIIIWYTFVVSMGLKLEGDYDWGVYKLLPLVHIFKKAWYDVSFL